jgi:SAM-dependent methyltransferase
MSATRSTGFRSEVNGADSIQECHTTQNFLPAVYVKQYYEYLGDENRAILEFLWRQFQSCPEGADMLDFGCGPTIYQFIAAAPKVRTIHVADSLATNFEAIQDWMAAKPDVFSWREYIRETLVLEDPSAVSCADICEREQLIKQKITRFLHCNLGASPPIAEVAEASYDVLMTNYCLEFLPAHIDFEAGMAQVLSLLRSGGRFILQFLRRTPDYPVGDHRFLCRRIDEDDFLRILPKCGFASPTIEYQIVEAEDGLNRPYESFVMMAASKA